MLYVGIPLLLLGLTMLARGWIYTFWPNGKIAEKRKRVNLRVGFTTDMKLFGRKVRRLGLMVAIVGMGFVGWELAERRDAARAEAEEAQRALRDELRGASTAPEAAAP
jgi:hypothetical protein